MANYGAAAFWDRVDLHNTGSSGATPKEYHWIDATHDRDYRDYELSRSSARWFFQPTTGATWDNCIVSGVNHSIPKPSGITVNEGYLHDSGSKSPLAKRRANEQGKEPDRSGGHLVPTSPHTCQTSVTIAADKQLQGTPIATGAGAYYNPVKSSGDFPYTLEGWCKGGTTGMVLGVSVWLDPDNSASGATPDDSWRYLGVGMHNGIPIGMWGGWGDVAATLGGSGPPITQQNYHRAWPDPNLTRGVDGYGWNYSTSSTENTFNDSSGDDLWHHLVMVVKSQKWVQIFYDGRMILNAKDKFWPVQEGSTYSHLRLFEDIVGQGASGDDRKLFKFSQFSSSERFAMQVGGVQHTHGSGLTTNLHTFDGDVAACATYDRELGAEEIMDHYVTMTQAYTIKLLGDNDSTGSLNGDTSESVHSSGYWVGPQGLREVTRPNTWGSGNADMFGMYHDRLWRDASQPSMEFLYKPGGAALSFSPLTDLTTLTQEETWSSDSSVADRRNDWTNADLLETSPYQNSRGFGVLVCAAPLYVCESGISEGGPAYPWANAAGGALPSWVGSTAAGQVAATATWEYKLFDNFGGSLDSGSNEGTGGLFRIGKNGSASTIQNYWLDGITGAHGLTATNINSGYEGSIRHAAIIEDRRFSVLSSIQSPKKIYGLVDLQETTSSTGGAGSHTWGSSRGYDLSSAGLSYPMRLFQAADSTTYTADTSANARGCQEPMMRLGMAAFFKTGLIPGSVGDTSEIPLTRLERAIRGRPPSRTRQSTQTPRRWFHCTRMALPRNTRSRLRER